MQNRKAMIFCEVAKYKIDIYYKEVKYTIFTLGL